METPPITVSAEIQYLYIRLSDEQLRELATHLADSLMRHPGYVGGPRPFSHDV